MKPLISIILLALLFIRCGMQTSPDTIKEAITGTYLRSSTHEFGSEHDTLVVAQQNEAANQYSITRKWAYARVLDGKALPPEYKKTTSVATYDESKKVLREMESGDTWSYDPAKEVLYAGTTVYQKQK